MASSCFSMTTPIFKIRFFLFLCFIGISSSQLSSDFYSTTCPNALSTIKSAVDSAVSNEARMGASLLRLHFHDCFVQASQLTQLHQSSFITSNFMFIVHLHTHMHTCLSRIIHKKIFFNYVAVLYSLLFYLTNTISIQTN